MATFMKQFQDEIRRLARKECKEDLNRLRKDGAEMKRAIADLKRRIGALKRENRHLNKVAKKVVSERPAVPVEKAERARISSKTIRTMRQRMGLTQAEFAKLAGVSGQSVYQWEAKDGQLQLRPAAKAAVVGLKGVGAREARRRLENME